MKNKYKQAWIESIRFETLQISIFSIITGSVLAAHDGKFKLNITILAIITAALLQILSNLANDYGDYINKCDTNERIGPLRGMQKGIITKSCMKKTLKINIFAICLSGLILIIVSLKKIEEITVFFILGVISIISAIKYTIGKKPYGYLGFGDIFVLIFFGWVSVIGTYYLQTNTFNIINILPATAFGLLSVTPLNINNMRDIENDAKVKKKTLAVRLGIKGAKIYHFIIIIISILCLICFNLLLMHDYKSWLFLITIPMYIKHIYNIFKNSIPKLMHQFLSKIIKISLLTNILFLLGMLISN
ncbi:1,4-dihydroxy-2-naphthoate octaprenyltransferase [Candidatus Providencia siddallii]|uniref:1,4-dihydroxy-2-naphthoate octaprenyltransferase n=1 Tax=Candidatus Providencia siddallii TaxID=1715285 RepID=A0A0M6W742_9GAMM|nr:1,4-dihydroxy-2-naphthoate octaprenyltransferase [Candidatus Providencia siddallii]